MSAHLMPPVHSIRVQREDFNLAAEMQKITAQGSDTGAVVTFTGLCRDEQGTLAALEIEHYPGMAEAEIARICAQAAKRWPLDGLVVIHRHGYIKAEEQIVLFNTASAQWGAAFAAVRYIMDFLKTDTPFWKKEYPADNQPGAWVSTHKRDDKSRNSW